MGPVADCTLIGTSADLLGLSCPVGPEGVIVGRSLEAALRLDSDGVSRFHARIERSRQGATFVSDLGSSNGTYVNGRRVSGPEPLQDGDRVRFGPHASFVVQYGAMNGGETLEIVDPAHGEGTVEILAKRNQARLSLAQRDYERARDLFAEVVAALDAEPSIKLGVVEDLAELLTELGRCHIGLGAHADAVPHCRRAIALLLGTSSGGKAVVRAKFVLGQALLPDDAEEARRIVAEAASSVEPGTALRQDLEAWLAVADPASVV